MHAPLYQVLHSGHLQLNGPPEPWVRTAEASLGTSPGPENKTWPSSVLTLWLSATLISGHVYFLRSVRTPEDVLMWSWLFILTLLEITGKKILSVYLLNYLKIKIGDMHKHSMKIIYEKVTLLPHPPKKNFQKNSSVLYFQLSLASGSREGLQFQVSLSSYE